MRAKRDGDLLYHPVTDRNRKLIMLMPTLFIFQKRLVFYKIRSPYFILRGADPISFDLTDCISRVINYSLLFNMLQNYMVYCNIILHSDLYQPREINVKNKHIF